MKEPSPRTAELNPYRNWMKGLVADSRCYKYDSTVRYGFFDRESEKIIWSDGRNEVWEKSK